MKFDDWEKFMLWLCGIPAAIILIAALIVSL